MTDMDTRTLTSDNSENRQKDKFIKVTQKITSCLGSVPKKQLLQEVADAGCDLFDVPVCIVWELDRTDAKLKVTACAGEVDENYKKTVQIDSQSEATRAFLKNRQSLAISDVRQAELYAHQKEARERNWVSLLTAPVIAQDQIIGILDVYTHSARQFTPLEKELLASLASQAGVAVGIAERDTRLVHLQDVTATISAGGTDLDAVLNLIANSLGDIFEDASCVIRLYDSETNEFTSYASTGVLRDVADLTPHPKGTSRYILETKVPRYLEGSELTAPPDKGPPIRKDILKKGVKATAYLPFLSEGDVIGILYVDMTTPHRFSGNDKQILELFAHQATGAIRNAQQRTADIAVVEEINAAITTKSWQHIAELIVQKVRDLTQADYSGLWVVEGNMLVLGSMYGEEGSLPAPPLSIDEHSINGWVAKTGERYICFDVKSDKYYKPWREDVQTSMAVPLKFGGKLIGTLSVESTKTNAFLPYHVKLLESLADQAAIAIENTRLYDEVRDSEEILSAIIEGSPVPTFVIDDQHIVTHWNMACQNLTDIPKDKVRGTKDAWRAFYATKRPVMADLVVDNALEEEITKHYSDKYQRSVLIEGAYEAEDFFPEFGKDGKWLFFTAAPLRDSSGKITGAIETLQDFTDRKQSELELELINRVGRAFSSTLDLNEVLSIVLEEVRGLLDITAASIWLIDLGTSELVCREATGPKRDTVRGWRLQSGEGFVGTVAQSGKSLIVADAWTDERHFTGIDQKTNMVLPSILSVPLKFRQDVIGVIQVLDKRVGRFNEADLTLLEPLATSAAIAIENASLFEELGEVSTRLVRLQEVAASISDDPSDFRNVLRLVARRLRDIFQAASCVIRLYDSKTNEFGNWVAEGVPEEEMRYLPRRGGTSWHVVNTKTPRYIEDTSVPPPDGSPAVRQEIMEQTVKAAAHLPLIGTEQNIIGVLYVNLTEPYRFSQNDRRTLELFAGQAAIAVENTQVYAELQALFAAMSDVILVYDRQGRYLKVVPPSPSHLLYKPAEEMVGKTVHQILPKSVADLCMGAIHRSLDNDETINVEYKLNIKGRKVWFDASVSPMTKEAVIFVARDISERKQAEEKLSRERDLLQALMDNIPDTIYFKDSGSRFTRVNEAQAQVLGIDTPEEAIGKTDFDFSFTKEHAQDAYTDERKIVESKEALINKVERIKKADGTSLWVSATKVPIIDEGGQVTNIVGISRDIDAQVQKAEQLELLHEIMATISAEPTDSNKVLRLIRNGVKKIFTDALCGIRLYDPVTEKLTKLIADDVLEAGVAGSEPRSGGTSEYVIKEREPFYAENASVTLPNGKPAIRDEIREKGVEAIAYLPLVGEQGVTGMLYVDWNAPRSFSKDNKQILQLFAFNAAIAITNARLFEQDQLRVSELEALSQLGDDLALE